MSKKEYRNDSDQFEVGGTNYNGCFEEPEGYYKPDVKEGPGPCPLCLSKTVLIIGKRGTFYGCSRFPNCKGSRLYTVNSSLLEENKRLKKEVEELKQCLKETENEVKEVRGSMIMVDLNNIFNKDGSINGNACAVCKPTEE